jgi:hypothetical protein
VYPENSAGCGRSEGVDRTIASGVCECARLTQLRSRADFHDLRVDDSISVRDTHWTFGPRNLCRSNTLKQAFQDSGKKPNFF